LTGLAAVLPLAAIAQAHALHGIEDAALHGLEAVADIGQGTALDHRQSVFEIGALCVLTQVQCIASGLLRQTSVV
jgi:hypothetical protein